jgi:hypothetical protein
MAKVVFNDGTSYTVKQDSLDRDRRELGQRSAADERGRGGEHGNGGSFDSDLFAGIEIAGDRGGSDGIAGSGIDGAGAQRSQDADQHEILMKKGASEVTRNGETVQLANWEKVSFRRKKPHMEKDKGTGPPTPISPANMAPIFTSGEADQGCGIFLDADGECSRLPAAHLEEPLLFFYTG